MPAMIGTVDVLLLPARDLGGKADVPLTVLEAMSGGRPVVVSDLPQMASLGDAVGRVGVGDADALVAEVARLQDEPGLWTARAVAGRELVEQKFSRTQMVARYAELYDELLAGRPPGPRVAHAG